jgi:hypothetical protein
VWYRAETQFPKAQGNKHLRIPFRFAPGWQRIKKKWKKWCQFFYQAEGGRKMNCTIFLTWSEKQGPNSGHETRRALFGRSRATCP